MSPGVITAALVPKDYHFHVRFTPKAAGNGPVIGAAALRKRVGRR
jgi:hypothetical protein